MSLDEITEEENLDKIVTKAKDGILELLISMFKKIITN
jgi:hypothetical protein